MKTFLIATLATLAFACAHTPTAAETGAAEKAFALQRASFDTKCDASKLTASELGNNKIGVRGCDQSCTYTVACKAGGACEATEANCVKDDSGAAK